MKSRGGRNTGSAARLAALAAVLAGGKQYIVVAVSERDHEGELVAFALP